MASQQQASTTPAAERDSWRTPLWLFKWLDQRFGFDVDLAASDDNTLCDSWITQKRNGLERAWRHFGGSGFLNPPYSSIGPWLSKSVIEAQRGFTTAALIPSPNGESYYGDHVFGVASELIFITGRIAFINSKGKPIGGNTRGSCIAIYAAHSLGDTRVRHVFRDEITTGV